MAGCFDYYAGLAEELDAKKERTLDVGSTDFSVKVCDDCLLCCGKIAHVSFKSMQKLHVLRSQPCRAGKTGCMLYCTLANHVLHMGEPPPVKCAHFTVFVLVQWECVQVRKEPLGVVALITPWNYPLLMAAVSG